MIHVTKCSVFTLLKEVLSWDFKNNFDSDQISCLNDTAITNNKKVLQ